MTLKDLKKTLSNEEPPLGISKPLEALWYEVKGDWKKAHLLIQALDDKSSAWVHAYLHRKEKDQSNASYWYNRAGKKMPECSFAEEWEQITVSLLES